MSATCPYVVDDDDDVYDSDDSDLELLDFGNDILCISLMDADNPNQIPMSPTLR